MNKLNCGVLMSARWSKDECTVVLNVNVEASEHGQASTATNRSKHIPGVVACCSYQGCASEPRPYAGSTVVFSGPTSYKDSRVHYLLTEATEITSVTKQIS